MEYATPVVEKISKNFLSHNPYAIEATKPVGADRYSNGEPPTPVVLAIIALAFEVSQLRYHLTHTPKTTTERYGSNGGG